MTSQPKPACQRPVSRRLSGALLLALAGCAAGPDFEAPESVAPDDWSSWRGADVALQLPIERREILPADWWTVYDDPQLESLLARAFTASPDLQSATLLFAQARVQRDIVASQRGPDLGVGASVGRQRQSEWGAGTRLIDAIAEDRDALVAILSEPFYLYQAGFDASWEPDLWGRVRRSIEAADADLAGQAALLDLARLSLSSDVARHYFELRTIQQQIRLAREDIEALQGRMDILGARVQAGVINDLDLERQRAELAAVRAQLPPLLAQEGNSANQIALLLGERPGALRDELAAPASAAEPALPDLALGLPSEVALRRPDIRAAEARLHRATASIGVARSALYPSIRIGGSFGFDSYLADEFADWGSRSWSIVPSIDLPLFDGGRRRGVVQLRELEQQQAAIEYQQTVLRAWHEIDAALTAYAAEQQQLRELALRAESAGDAYQLAQARYDGGMVDFTVVLDSERGYLQARRDLAASEGRLKSQFVMINKVIGNVMPADESAQSVAALEDRQ